MGSASLVISGKHLQEGDPAASFSSHCRASGFGFPFFFGMKSLLAFQFKLIVGSWEEWHYSGLPDLVELRRWRRQQRARASGRAEKSKAELVGVREKEDKVAVQLHERITMV